VERLRGIVEITQCTNSVQTRAAINRARKCHNQSLPPPLYPTDGSASCRMTDLRSGERDRQLWQSRLLLTEGCVYATRPVQIKTSFCSLRNPPVAPIFAQLIGERFLIVALRAEPLPSSGHRLSGMPCPQEFIAKTWVEGCCAFGKHQTTLRSCGSR